MSNTALRANKSVVSNKAKPPTNFAVIMKNDDYTPATFVTQILIDIFGLSPTRAEILTETIHTGGIGVAGVYRLEIAEQKAYETLIISGENEYPLQVILDEIA
jgi:ATP-dependent Clp protease adaptor protein ClpS